MVNSTKIFRVITGGLVRCPMAFRCQHRSIMSTCWYMQKITNANQEAKTPIKMIAQTKQQEIQQPKEQIQKLELHQEKKEKCQQQLQEIANPIIDDDEEEPSFMINDFLVRFYGSAVELEKELPTDHIHIYFNINKSMPRHLREYVRQLRTPNPVHSVPNLEVAVKRGDWILSLYCGFKTEVFLNDVLPIDPQSNQLDVFEIKDISIFQHLWDEFTYTTNQYMVDHDVLRNIKKTLKNLGITNEFSLKMSYLATAHADATKDVFVDDLIKFGVGMPKIEQKPTKEPPTPKTALKQDEEVN